MDACMYNCRSTSNPSFSAQKAQPAPHLPHGDSPIQLALRLTFFVSHSISNLPPNEVTTFLKLIEPGKNQGEDEQTGQMD